MGKKENCEPLSRKRVSQKFPKNTLMSEKLPLMEGKSCTIWGFILYCNERLEYQTPFTTPRIYFAKKDQPGVPKIVGKDPENLRIIA